MRALALLWIAVACSACAGEVSEVLVRIDAQPASRVRAHRVRVHVITTEGAVVTHDLSFEDGALEYPLVLPLVPNGDPASRTWRVEAELLDASNTPFAWARLRGGYVRGEIREALLCFTDLCSDVPCDSCLPSGDAGPGGACTTCTGAARSCEAAPEAVLLPRGSAAVCEPVQCVPMGASETICTESDPSDDDCDEAYNCQDADCDGASCGANSRTCMGRTCACPLGDGEDTIALCHDGVDNDCDGATDCADQDPCRTFTEDCGTAMDEDCDGLTGCADPDCVLPENCSTPADEDCDGETSCDADCPLPDENDPTFCHNGIDDDCDGWTDCDDEECCANGNCNGRTVASRGSYPRMRCCNGDVFDVFANENHCGACNLGCDAGFQCVLVANGAACRCARGDDSSCPAGFLCRDLEGQVTCDCDANGDCGHYMDCRLRGASFHNLCGPLS